MHPLPMALPIEISATTFIFVLVVMTASGIVKGAIGFALPLLFLGGLSVVMPVKDVVALIAFPAIVTSFLQAQRNGARAFFESLREFWLLHIILFVSTFYCTRLVVALPQKSLFLILGTGAFTLALLLTFKFPGKIPHGWRRILEVPYALVAGFFGGLSGFWGTVLLTYFLALRLPKEKFVRTTGVTWLVASIPYVAGHIENGVLSLKLAAWSALALIPTLAGMWIGRRIQDRLNPAVFRRLVLAVLLLATLNLIRRGIWG